MSRDSKILIAFQIGVFGVWLGIAGLLVWAGVHFARKFW